MKFCIKTKYSKYISKLESWNTIQNLGMFLKENYFRSISEYTDYREHLFVKAWGKTVKDNFGEVTPKMYVTADFLKNCTSNTVPTSTTVANTAGHRVKCYHLRVTITL